MTIPAYAEAFSERLPSVDEVQAANQLRQIIAAHANDGATLTVLDADSPVNIALSPALSELLLDLLRHIGSGDAVTLVPIHELLTTQQAADILNVSRPHLIKLLETGEMPFDKVGRHRRIKARDVFEYKKRREEERSRALDELFADDADLI
ncbi:helix-turn-helix domain-containing protein [Novosphingobium naphthalenivorans]|uniref:helix-turn-helix domain-containing protein n=1 Tax=Novosphingobium naphthalenivorans TaxID=273168 RepID=UPI000835107C|nr:helix-turn-helix domain-containing protein [Novosphingobium naphthalenivorans]